MTSWFTIICITTTRIISIRTSGTRGANRTPTLIAICDWSIRIAMFQTFITGIRTARNPSLTTIRPIGAPDEADRSREANGCFVVSDLMRP